MAPKYRSGIQWCVPYAGNYLVSLANKGDMPMPCLIEITFEDELRSANAPGGDLQRGDVWNHLHQGLPSRLSVIM